MRGSSAVLAAALLAASSPGVSGSWATSDSLPSLGRRAWSYGLVLGHDQIRDDLLLPLVWTGPSLGLQAGVLLPRRSGLHRVSLVVPLSLLHERYGHPGYALGFELAYSHQRVAIGDLGGGTLLVGARLGLDQHNGIYESWDDEHLYWFTAYGLGPAVAWRSRPTPGRAIELHLDVPLLAAVSRPSTTPPRKRDPLTNFGFHVAEPLKGATLTTIPRYTAVRAGAEVVREVGGVRLLLSYDFAVSTYESPARVVVLSHRFGIQHSTN